MLAPVPSISDLRSMADKAIGFRDALTKQHADNTAEIKRLENEDATLRLVASLIRSLADAEVKDGIEAVTKLQTEGLQEIFYNQDLRMEAEITEQRGKVAVNLLTVDKKDEGIEIKDDPLESMGGSVASVESVLLRVIVILRRGMRPMILLDETLSAIAKGYIERMAGFLTTLCSRLGMDILAVSHDPLLIDAAQKAYVIEATPRGVVFKERR
jgi:hypothetical protein